LVLGTAELYGRYIVVIVIAIGHKSRKVTGICHICVIVAGTKATINFS